MATPHRRHTPIAGRVMGVVIRLAMKPRGTDYRPVLVSHTVNSAGVVCNGQRVATIVPATRTTMETRWSHRCGGRATTMKQVARPEGLEPPTPWFEAKCAL